MSAVSRKDFEAYKLYVAECSDQQLNAAWWLEHRGRNRRFERECMMEAVRRGIELVKPDVYESRRNKQAITAPFKPPAERKPPTPKPRTPPPDPNILLVQVREVLDALTPAQRLEGVSLSELQTNFSGRQRGYCHPGELGSALRTLGWKRWRKWNTMGEAFPARWFPPDVSDLRQRIADTAATMKFINHIQEEITG